MRKVVLIFLLLLISITIGWQIKIDPGYCLFSLRGWTVEMPVWCAALVWFVGYFALNAAWRILYGIWRFPHTLSDWLARRKIHRARFKTSKGLIALAEGNWHKAEGLLVNSAGSSEVPLINYLAAALAAQKQVDYKHRDLYLQLAHKSTPDAEIAIGLTQAQLQYDRRQYEQALATLCHLKQLAPRHEYVLRLLHALYLQLQDWPNVLALLPELKKQRILAKDEYNKIQLVAHEGMLDHVNQTGDLNELISFWDEMPKYLQRNSEMALRYIDYLLAREAHAQAYEGIVSSLKHEWDSRFMQRYADCMYSDKQKQLNTGEAWLRRHSNDPELHFCLGRLSLRLKLWGKARRYLEYSQGLKPQLKVYRELGMLLTQLEEREEALECYRQGIEEHFCTTK